MKLGTEAGLGPGHIVLDGDPLSFSQKGTQQPPTFRPVCCSQTAGWIKWPGPRPTFVPSSILIIKMLLGTKVGLDPGHIVLDGDLSPLERDTPPLFGLCLL